MYCSRVAVLLMTLLLIGPGAPIAVGQRTAAVLKEDPWARSTAGDYAVFFLVSGGKPTIVVTTDLDSRTLYQIGTTIPSPNVIAQSSRLGVALSLIAEDSGGGVQDLKGTDLSPIAGTPLPLLAAVLATVLLLIIIFLAKRQPGPFFGGRIEEI